MDNILGSSRRSALAAGLAVSGLASHSELKRATRSKALDLASTQLDPPKPSPEKRALRRAVRVR